jgi:hypothetical protein
MAELRESGQRFACEAFCAAVGRRLRSEKRPFALFSRRKKLEETRNLGYCFS